MPRIAATTGGAEETQRLMVLMAERITQALTRTSTLFRPGRGQMTDFAERYGLMATTAKRILSGTAFPTHVLLLALSKDVGVPIDWFFGGGHFNIDDEVANATVQIPIHGQEATVGLPRAALRTVAEDTDFVAMVIDSNDLHPHVSAGDIGLIAISQAPCFGDPPCGVIYGSNPNVITLASITRADARGDMYLLTNAQLQETSFRAAQVVFGDAKPSKVGVRVIGPLVGRVCFDGLDPIGFLPRGATTKRKTPQLRKKPGG